MTYFVDAIVKCRPSHVNTFTIVALIDQSHDGIQFFYYFFLDKNFNLPKRNRAIPSRLICVMASYLQSSEREKRGWRFKWRKTGWDFKKYFIFTTASRFTNIINEFFCSIGWKEAKKENIVRVKDWKTNTYWRTNSAQKKND